MRSATCAPDALWSVTGLDARSDGAHRMSVGGWRAGNMCVACTAGNYRPLSGAKGRAQGCDGRPGEAWRRRADHFGARQRGLGGEEAQAGSELREDGGTAQAEDSRRVADRSACQVRHCQRQALLGVEVGRCPSHLSCHGKAAGELLRVGFGLCRRDVTGGLGGWCGAGVAGCPGGPRVSEGGQSRPRCASCDVRLVWPGDDGCEHVVGDLCGGDRRRRDVQGQGVNGGPAVRVECQQSTRVIGSSPRRGLVVVLASRVVRFSHVGDPPVYDRARG